MVPTPTAMRGEAVSSPAEAAAELENDFLVIELHFSMWTVVHITGVRLENGLYSPS